MLWYYTIITIFTLLIIFLLDFFSLKIYKHSRFWILIFLTIILQTIVDNYLNRRWLMNSYIVGNYNYYSQIKIYETPLENYFFGIAMIWLNVIIYEIILKKSKLF